MSLKDRKSKSAVEEAAEKWTKNLKSITKRRPELPELKHDINEALCKIPTNKTIVGRFLGLYDVLKGRHDRIRKISNELLLLWEKLNFPSLSKQQVQAKLDKLLILFESYKKRKNKEFEDNLSKLFDITKMSGNWLNREDKDLYETQIQSGGKVGYTTAKEAPLSTIHPSKRIKMKPESSTSQTYNVISSDDEDESTDEGFDFEEILGKSP